MFRLELDLHISEHSEACVLLPSHFFFNKLHFLKLVTGTVHQVIKDISNLMTNNYLKNSLRTFDLLYDKVFNLKAVIRV